MTIEEQVTKALNEDIDLSKEEYKAKKIQADKITGAHGVEGKAPLSETQRLKRMLMNYMGSSLNIFVSILSELDNVSRMIQDQNALLSAIYLQTKGDKK